MGHPLTKHFVENNYDIHFFKDDQKIFIDGGCDHGGKLNVLVIEDEDLQYNRKNS